MLWPRNTGPTISVYMSREELDGITYTTLDGPVDIGVGLFTSERTAAERYMAGFNAGRNTQATACILENRGEWGMRTITPIEVNAKKYNP